MRIGMCLPCTERDMDVLLFFILFLFLFCVLFQIFNTTASNYCHFGLKMVSFISLNTHAHTHTITAKYRGVSKKQASKRMNDTHIQLSMMAF